MQIIINILGLIGFMVIGWFFSAHRRILNWRVIFWGLVLQFSFALFIFIVPAGTKVFLIVNDIVVRVLECANRGTSFVFGNLASPPGSEGSFGFVLAFQALPTIIFFSSLMAILYYFNIMGLIVRGFSIVFSTLMRISGAEALSSASNIFVGVESAFTVRPYIKNMTQSELCTLLTAGMATIGSNVLALYVFTLQNVFPTIAGHLVSASILSAPAAILMSKIVIPETEQPETLGKNIKPHYEKPANFFLAIIESSKEAVTVIFGIVALLIAVLGLTALVDMVLAVFHPSLSLKMIIGYIALPLTYLLGVNPIDVGQVATLIGEKIILTEVVAYQDLATMIGNKSIHDPRSVVIATYALCGFTHLASMAIFVGGLSGLAPEKAKEISKVSFRALLAATLACLMTGGVAGIFFTGSSVLLQ